MKIQVDGIDVFELTPVQKKVIQHEVFSAVFDADMKRRLCWVLSHKYEECFIAFREEWEQRLIAKGVASLPVGKDEFATLVFAQPEYKDAQEQAQFDIDEDNKKLLANDPSATPLTLDLSYPIMDPFKKSAG